jgi:uncharacterized membrane protein YqgA involved in biofilm formation
MDHQSPRGRCSSYRARSPLGAALLDAFVTKPMMSATTATGGIPIFGLGLVLLDLIEIRAAKMVPPP